MTREGESTRITLDEATLLAWVEGELPPETHRRVSLALSREPRLRELAEGMLGDRDAFRSMGDETAPAALLSDVADALEREMLVGLAEEGTAVSSKPPKSIVAGRIGPSGGAQKQRFGNANGLWQDRFARRLAMAAGLFLVVGGAGTLGVLLWPDRSPTMSPSPLVFEGPIAMGESEETAPAAEFPDATPPLDQYELSFSEPLGPEPVGGDIPRTTRSRESSLAESTPRTEPATPGIKPVDTEQAARLAAEGRLLVRVRSVDLGEMLVGIDRLGTQRRVDVVPRDLIAGDLDRLTIAMDEERRRMPKLAVASDPAASEREPSPPRERPVLAEQIRVIEVAPDARELALLRSRLLGEQAMLVEFFGTDEPMPVGAPPSVDELLWWTLPPDRWSVRVRVPVLIEGGD